MNQKLSEEWLRIIQPFTRSMRSWETSRKSKMRKNDHTAIFPPCSPPLSPLNFRMCEFYVNSRAKIAIFEKICRANRKMLRFDRLHFGEFFVWKKSFRVKNNRVNRGISVYCFRKIVIHRVPWHRYPQNWQYEWNDNPAFKLWPRRNTASMFTVVTVKPPVPVTIHSPPDISIHSAIPGT